MPVTLVENAPGCTRVMDGQLNGVHLVAEGRWPLASSGVMGGHDSGQELLRISLSFHLIYLFMLLMLLLLLLLLVLVLSLLLLVLWLL